MLLWSVRMTGGLERTSLSWHLPEVDSSGTCSRIKISIQNITITIYYDSYHVIPLREAIQKKISFYLVFFKIALTTPPSLFFGIL